MGKLNKKRLFFYMLLSLGIGIFCAVILGQYNPFYFMINGMFMGGMFTVAAGLFQYVRYLGFFDLFVYSHRKLFQYSKWNKNVELEDQEELKSFHDYKLNLSKTAGFGEPLAVGGFFALAGLLLSLSLL